MKNIIVQKYGGSSLQSPEQIKRIAQQVATRHQQGEKLIIVVSAMGKTTDHLLNLALQISPIPAPRELDMLLTTGERQAMALLTMALIDLGCPAISFTGSQAGVLTDASHREAHIIEIKPTRVQQAIENNQVVVLAGFQGVHPQTKEITTLGRGGSDTTAVAFADYFNAEKCEIRKDVDGLFSADPKLYDKAHIIPEVSYEVLLEMCHLGARVLHTRAIDYALKKSVPLYIGHSEKNSLSTLITHHDRMQVLRPLAINALDNIIKVNHSLDKRDIQKRLKDFFIQCQLPLPTIIGHNDDLHNLSIYLHHFEDLREVLLEKLTQFQGTQTDEEPLSCVSLSFSQELPLKDSLEILHKIKSLATPLKGHLQHQFSFSFFIDPQDKITLVKKIHEAFLSSH